MCLELIGSFERFFWMNATFRVFVTFSVSPLKALSTTDSSFYGSFISLNRHLTVSLFNQSVISTLSESSEPAIALVASIDTPTVSVVLSCNQRALFLFSSSTGSIRCLILQSLLTRIIALKPSRSHKWLSSMK
jgi:hypothetical protein